MAASSVVVRKLLWWCFFPAVSDPIIKTPRKRVADLHIFIGHFLDLLKYA